MKYFYDTKKEEIYDWVKENGFPHYRADQILSWKSKGITSYEQMGNIPKTIREKMSSEYYMKACEVMRKDISAGDGTIKYILRLNDGNIIECVLMRYTYGNSVCISSQAGCRMGCTFCASAKAGFGRNLSSGEMLMQVLTVSSDISERISNIVVMGIGEPFDNYDNLVRFIKDANDPDILGIGMRHMSVSTCGLVSEMIKFSEERLPVTLSVSLHAPNDIIRRKLMPIAMKYNMQELLNACRKYIDKTKRRITFEYILIRDMNDADEHARELSEKLKGMLCHVNLIPANEFEGSDYTRSTDKRIKAFRDILENEGINVTVRRELGTDIEAACGQLRRNILQGGS